MSIKNIFQIVLILLTLFNNVFSAENNDIIKTRINKVKVYNLGALVERQGIFNVKKGIATIEFKGIPEMINNKTIIITSDNNSVKILDYNFYKEKTNSQIEKSNLYEEKIVDLEKQIRLFQNRDKNRKEKMLFYEGLKGGLNSIVKQNYSIAINKELFKIEDFAFLNIKKETVTFNSFSDSISQLQKQIKAFTKKSKELKYIPKQTISVNIKSTINTQTKFTVKYFIKNAGWYPFYNVDILPNNDKTKLNFLASIYQETGEDWEDVKLTVSGENLKKLNKTPDVKRIVLTKYNNNNILGASIYKPNLKKYLKKPKVKEFFIREFNTDDEKKEFILKNKHTLKSSGRNLKVKLETKYLKSKYRDIIYLNKSVEINHRIKIYNNSSRTYDRGNVNLFLETEFKGKDTFPKITPDDSISFTLGTDRNISINKKTIDSKLEKATVFNSIETKREKFEFTIKNNGKFKRRLTLVDYISVSRNSDVKIKMLNSKWKYNATNGKIECEIIIKPNEEIVLPMGFEISSPEGKFY